jgi:hypothetical protein
VFGGQRHEEILIAGVFLGGGLRFCEKKIEVSSGQGCMRSMQRNVDFGYRLSICSRAEKNHEIPSSSWPVAEPGGYALTCSQWWV